MCESTLDKARELQDRTKQFALRVIRMFRSLPETTDAQIIGKQVLRSGTSLAANYRAACRSRSPAEFASRIGLVVEETDETVFWMELLVASDIVKLDMIEQLMGEAEELRAIFSASRRTSKRKN